MRGSSRPIVESPGPNPPDRESVAEFVRERRTARRLTQRELAELAGVGPRLIWDLERGKSTLRMDAVNRVLAVFGKRLGAISALRAGAEEGQ